MATTARGEVKGSMRYGVMSDRLLLCRDCSTRTLGYLIPADEREAHDDWHAAQV
jgi:hypothetical protein